MTTSAAGPSHTVKPVGSSESSSVTGELASYWWLWLVTGILWVVAALVVLQFNSASVKTIGVIAGCMFAAAGVQQLVVAFIEHRILTGLFGVCFLAAAIVAFVEPAKTFAGLADILGFLFLLVGIVWTVEAFLAKSVTSLWWVGLTSGVLMIVLAFWTSGQFFLEKAYTLLVFSGIWALMKGVTDIVRAFQVRGLRDAI